MEPTIDMNVTQQKKHTSRMLGFTIIWFGQLFSMLGTGMTQFALTIWA